MKMHLMYDPDGRIVAAVRLDGGGKAESHRGGRRLPGIRPVLRPGHATAELDVPSEHAHLTFHEACKQLIVDLSETKPRLKLSVPRQSK